MTNTIKTVRIFSLSPEKGTKKKQRVAFGKAIRKASGMKLPDAIMMAKGLMRGKELGDFFGKEGMVAFEPGGRIPYFYLEGKEGIRIIDLEDRGGWECVCLSFGIIYARMYINNLLQIICQKKD